MRRLWWAALAFALLVLFLAAAVTLVLRSAWFHEQVRARVVREIESATGGRVEMGDFRFDWKTKRAQVDNLVVHGTEKAGAPPLFAVERATVGIKILSTWRREIDILSLELEHPCVHYDGTNLPPPRVAVKPGRDPFEAFLQLAVGEYRLRQGEFHYRDARIPFDVEGKDLDLRMGYDRSAPAYEGEIAAKSVKLAQPLEFPTAMAVAAKARFERERVTLSSFSVSSRHSKAAGKGEWRKGEAAGDVDADVSLAEWGGLLRLPVDHRGEAQFKGKVRYKDKDSWDADGHVAAKGLQFRGISNIEVEGPVRANSERIEAAPFTARALGGRFEGKARVERFKTFSAEGDLQGFTLNRLLAAAGRPSLDWNATVAGAVRVNGPDLVADARLRITPVEEGNPQGEVALRYEQRSGDLSFEPSYIQMPSSRVNFAGKLQQRIEVGVISKDLDDFLPLTGLDEMPLSLEQGQAKFNGSIAGRLDAPRVLGHLEIGPFSAGGTRVREVSGEIDATPSEVRATRLKITQDELTLEGYTTATLANWKLQDASAITAKLVLRDTSVAQLAKLAKADWSVTGSVGVQLDVQGTYGSPRVIGRATSAQLDTMDETFRDLEADFRYSESRIEVVNGRARKEAGLVEFAGAVEKEDIRAQVALRNSRLALWTAIHDRQPNLDGRLALKGEITGRRAGSQFQLTSLAGDVAVEDLSVSGRRAGDFKANARTRGRVTYLELNGQVRESSVRGSAEWSLASGTSLGLGQMQATNLTFAALQDLGLFGDPAKELPIKGFLNAEIGFSGPILRPDRWTGLAKVTQLEVESSRRPPSRGVAQRFVLRNQEPLLVYLDSNGANLQAVHLVAEGTDLEATGTVSYRARNPWNLRLKGRVNLPVLSTFEPDLVANGVSTIDATVRGSLDRPNLTGRMEIRNASMNLRNVPNGLDKLSGAIVFDRTRANIERVTAQSGGGELALTGFVDFGGSELLYALQAQAQRVRVRYPQSMSTTFNGQVTVTGTAARSLLSGRATILKVTLDPRTDIGGLLAETGRGPASSAGAPNEFLRNMQLDLKVVTAPDAELQSSLARDVQPEASLQVRGSAVRPVLLGRISVNQGEIQFFGNQYTIARGDVSFFNPIKIEPVIDLDLETKVRGVTVNINFTGPINKLDVSYRSDPPLQSSEIVALLAVGRTPGSGITPNLPTQNQAAFLQPGNNTLLGQAVTAPFNSRLTRLFGVSRIKIDPELTGVTNTPQARLTVEQQLSRDITVTYITNLNRTQQQIVRLQWDFSRDFSVLAVRDENGVFGVDFLWRKRFK